MYKQVDMASWPRAAHCAAFRGCLNPRWGVAFEMDVSAFRAAVKEANLSFSLAFIWTVSSIANSIEAFRYRFLDGAPVLYDRIDPSFTYLRDGESLFRVVRVPMTDSPGEFVSSARQHMREQRGYFPAGGRQQDVFQFSSLPWIHFTQLTHTVPADPDNAAPLFDWGKFTAEGERCMLPFSAEAHHSFVDGVHMGELAERLEDAMQHPPGFS